MVNTVSAVVRRGQDGLAGIARRGEGRYVAIEQGGGKVAVETPFDGELAEVKARSARPRSISEAGTQGRPKRRRTPRRTRAERPPAPWPPQRRGREGRGKVASRAFERESTSSTRCSPATRTCRNPGTTSCPTSSRASRWREDGPAQGPVGGTQGAAGEDGRNSPPSARAHQEGNWRSRARRATASTRR